MSEGFTAGQQDEIYLSGFARRPAAPIRLRAGPLSLWFNDGALRYTGNESTEAVRGVYVAVRDEYWGTVPAELSGLEIANNADHFRIAYTAIHKRNEVDFIWRATIDGRPDGTIQFVMEGEARRDFRRNRIGFCVLHPINECIGRRCWVRRSDGETSLQHFPTRVAAAQPVEGFEGISAMAYEIGQDLWAELNFSGDVFEMEDQRNWTDASYKTYCTPLRLPIPVTVKAGTKLRQEVTLQLFVKAAFETRWPYAPKSDFGFKKSQGAVCGFDMSGSVTVHMDSAAKPFELPEIGLQVGEVTGVLDDSELENSIRRLATLGLAHLRADVHLAQSDWRLPFISAAKVATLLRLPLELAVHFSREPSKNLVRIKELAKLLSGEEPRQLHTAKLKRLLIVHEGQHSTTLEALQMARTNLGKFHAPIGAGTNGDLYQLHLQRPPVAEADFIFWSMNPQVHAFDNRSIAETPEMATHQICAVKECFPGKPICISPVTLKPRGSPTSLTSPNELPQDVDARQSSMFGAGWTLAMLKNLAGAGASSITLYEMIGWLGVMESKLGSRLPEKFPSVPGGVFPLFHVLADLAGFTHGSTVVSSRPTTVEATAISNLSGRGRLLLANLTGERQQVELGVPFSAARVSIMNGENARGLMENPGLWRNCPTASLQVKDGLKLAPYALARLDFTGP
jgi:hypothetical protein